MKHLWIFASALQFMLAIAQQSPLLVPSDFVPSVATIIRLADPTPTEQRLAPAPDNQPYGTSNSVIVSGKSMSQCGPSVTCHLPPMSSIVTVYDSTTTQIKNTTTIESQYYTNTVVDLLVSVISSTIAHEGICTRDVTVRMPLLVITVGRNVTSTNFYLKETTTTQTTTTVVSVTSSHACTKSVPPDIIPIPPTPGFPQPLPDPAPGDFLPSPPRDSRRQWHPVPVEEIELPAADDGQNDGEQDDDDSGSNYGFEPIFTGIGEY